MGKTWRRAKTDWDDGGYNSPRDFTKKKKKASNKQKIETRKRKEQYLEEPPRNYR